MTVLALRWVPADHPAAAVLATRQQHELATENPDDHHVYALHDEIEFVVAEDSGHAVGCGALQRLDPTTAEVKRMYVVPEARRRGLSRVILAAIEDRARELGITHLRLETALAFTAAVALYRSAGYHEIPPYGEYAGNPISYCMERQL
jgi:GNAT superfamily N-acetyltransferase